MNKLCETCKHLIRHYHNLNGVPHAINCGHCRKTKGRKILTEWGRKCEYHEEEPQDEKTVTIKLSIKDINIVIDKLENIKKVFKTYVDND